MLNNFLKYPAILICCFILSICNVSKSDQTVSEIQTMLKDQGYDIGIVDGISGKITVREIKNWQYLNAFNESGNINQEQLNILRNQYSFAKTLTNEEMKVVQERNKNVPTITKKSNMQKEEKGDFYNTLDKGIMISAAISIWFLLAGLGRRDKRYSLRWNVEMFSIGVISLFVCFLLWHLQSYLYG